MQNADKRLLHSPIDVLPVLRVRKKEKIWTKAKQAKGVMQYTIWVGC